MRLTISLVAMLCALGAARADEAPPAVLIGTDGLTAVPFTAENESAGSIACDAAIAHWYSATLGEAAPGARVEATFWSEPASGVLYVLNDKRERMPVQALWCGVAGRSASTRSDVQLARRIGIVEPAIHLVCMRPTPDGRLGCLRDTSD